MNIESVQRIEPTHLEVVSGEIQDVSTDLATASAKLGNALHPKTASSLADLVRIMNAYYSNLIEGNNTRPRDIERALAGQFDDNVTIRNLQMETAAHVRVQVEIDRLASQDKLSAPGSIQFIRWLHCEFYRDAPQEKLQITGRERSFQMVPGAWRSLPDHDVSVGRHTPPSSDRIDDFMAYFENRYNFERLGSAARIVAIATAHHRFNYIHPFPDGNGRVSRLMSHAMALISGIGAHGLWSISRGLARGLESRGDYKCMMDHADMSRQGDLDGRGNLSQRALSEFVLWFLRVCLDQVTYMSGLFELNTLALRLQIFVEKSEVLRPEASRLLQEALIRGVFERGDVSRITGLPERTARRVFQEVLRTGLLSSDTPKGAVYLRFPVDTLDVLFPRLFPET